MAVLDRHVLRFADHAAGRIEFGRILDQRHQVGEIGECRRRALAGATYKRCAIGRHE